MQVAISINTLHEEITSSVQPIGIRSKGCEFLTAFGLRPTLLSPTRAQLKVKRPSLGITELCD